MIGNTLASTSALMEIWSAKSSLKSHIRYGVYPSILSIIILVAIGAGDVSVWDIQRNKTVWRYEGKSGWVLKTAFSADGTKIAAMGYYEDVYILDAQTGEILHDFSGHYFIVNSIAYSPDGHMLAVASDDGFCVYSVPDD